MIRRNAGFTIIELLIATVIFSVILLVMAGAMIQIGRLYMKGVTNSRTQEAARAVANDITQALQYGSSGVDITPDVATPGLPVALCVGTRQYSFVQGQQRKGSAHAVVVRSMPGGCNDIPAQDLSGALPVEGTELLGEAMRVSNIDVRETSVGSGAYSVTVRVAYGDADLLCGGTFSCTSDSVIDFTTLSTTKDLRCKDIQSGTQFCSAAELTTTVERRLE